MSHFQSVFSELRDLESRLKTTVNRLWSIRLALASAYRQGQHESDFLPRRMMSLKRTEQVRFERLLHRLNRILSTALDSTFVLFTSAEEAQAATHLRKTLRYIQNAFVGDPSIRCNLARVHHLLEKPVSFPIGSNN